MPEGTAVFAALLGLLVVQRLAELVVNARNLAGLVARGAVLHRQDGYGLLVLVHGSIFFLAPLEWFAAPWAGWHRATLPLLALYVGAEALRYWSSFTLGWRWTTRVVVLAGLPPIRTGPYRFLAHPIYVAVAAAMFALPAAFGLWGTAVGLGAVNLLALRRRIQREEAAWAGALHRGQGPADVGH